MIDTLEDRADLDAALGSRVARLGSTIHRSPARHYLGRVFASAASLALGCRVYDTQCGAKMFRVTPALRAALERPFRSAWAFDVELLARLLNGDATVDPVPLGAMVEVPLDEWREMGASRLGPRAMLSAFSTVVAMTVERRGRPLP